MRTRAPLSIRQNTGERADRLMLMFRSASIIICAARYLAGARCTFLLRSLLRPGGQAVRAERRIHFAAAEAPPR